MNGPKYTPGPWKIDAGRHGDRMLIVHGNIETVSPIIAEVLVGEGLPQATNAALIAAAPGVIAALDTLVRMLNGPDDFTTRQIDEAIRDGIAALQDAGVYE